MATIKISDLNPTGFELINDSESYLNELTDSENINVLGGGGAFTFGGKHWYFSAKWD